MTQRSRVGAPPSADALDGLIARAHQNDKVAIRELERILEAAAIGSLRPGSDHVAAEILAGDFWKKKPGGGIRDEAEVSVRKPKVGTSEWAATLSTEPVVDLQKTIGQLAQKIGAAKGVFLEVSNKPEALLRGMHSHGIYPVYVDGEKAGSLSTHSPSSHMVAAGERQLAESLIMIVVKHQSAARG